MKKIIIIFFLLLPLLIPSQYTRHYKEPKKLSKGAVLTIGGLTFTAVPMIAELTSTTTPFKRDKTTPGININPNKVAISCGVTVTLVGLITLIAER